jgi:flagella basal body P-ring formation protein FlgA
MWKNKMKTYFILFITILMSVDVSASLNKTLAHGKLLKDVISYVEQEFNPDESKNLKIVAHPLDSRISIKECDKNLLFTVAKKRSFSRQFPVKATCPSENSPWKVFVQVSLSEMIEALVTSQAIAKGVTVDAGMVEIVLVDAQRIRNRSSTDLSAIIGGRALKNIQRGYQIGQGDVCLVCKGDDVSIIAKNNSMMIKTSGTAIESGAKGESIKVKNNSSNRIIKGIIGDLREIYVNL